MRSPTILLTLGLALVTLASSNALAAETNSPATADRKFTFVIVHGAWGGGWAFKEVDKLLTADGHKVYRPTLTGQGERVHLAQTNHLGSDIDLSLHIQDIVNVILWEDLREVVLVGHSYGGMVITGVADRVPERIRHMVYLDAFVPENGEALDTSMGQTNRQRAVVSGFLPAFGPANRPLPHDVPHPAKTVSEPISLTNQAVASKLPTTYILTVDRGREAQRDTFFRFSERAKSRDWKVINMEGDHNVMWSRPKELVDLLEKAP